MNFVLGRQLSYEAVKNIGANQTSLLSIQTIYAVSFASALIFGFTPILIKLGLSNYHSFVSGTFIAYLAAMVGYALAIKPGRVSNSIKTIPRYAFYSYVVAGGLAVAAQLLRFGALSFAPVVLVAPILASQPVFTLILSRKLAKDFEIFKPKTICAISIVVAGSVVLSIFSGIAT